MKYAVMASGGKQYKVSEGTVVELDKLKTADGEQVTFNDVLLLVEDGIVMVGQPTVPGVAVTGKVLESFKARKIRVSKFKAKARYRKVYGHRQSLTKVQIESIGKAGKEVKSQKSKVESAKNKEKTAKA